MEHWQNIDELIAVALREDVGTGDITTVSTISEDAVAHGRFILKEDSVVCGFPVAERVFHAVDPNIRFRNFLREGHAGKKGEIVADVAGPARAVLTAERVALNLLQHLSGIAQRTSEAVAAVEGTGALITDTRKTTPGLRVLEKYAVRMGGGTNHRFNLSDGILIKDNHIAAAGGIAAAVASARKRAPHTLKIEVECETLEQVAEALGARAEIIMLDNMSLENMKKAVELIDGRAITEASGNMGERDLREVALTGVNLISVGALTHTVRAADISLKFDVNAAE